MSQFAARDYLRSAAGLPWKWEEDGRVLAWHDGTTLAFREEIELILQRLAPAGLPPFNALVVLLAGCRGKIGGHVAGLSANTGSQQQLLVLLRAQQERKVDEQFARLRSLPAELLRGAQGKALLAEVIFERVARHSVADSELIVRGFAELPLGAEQVANSADSPKANFDRTTSEVAEALRPHTAESLLRRLRTGLDALPAAAPAIELPRGERVRRLLEALRTDESLAGLARVVRDLTAALRLPRTLVQVTESTGGGAADIANRGPLDRLLLSELAHDDLVLASRLALSEALYLHREPPSNRPQRTLAVLLDVGIRMWGVPRVLGVAAALALITRHPADCGVMAWRAAGREIQPVDLLDKKELEAHLAELGTDLNPAAAIPALVTRLAETPEVDLVIVTHRDALEDAGFQGQLAQARFERGFLLLVERDGTVQLHRLPWGSPRPLAQSTVNIADLFPTAPRRSAPPLIVAHDDDFPAIFRARPFPLLLPVNTKMDRSIAHKEGGVCVTADRRLLAWDKAALGARQLATDLPAGATIWLHRDRAGRTIVVKGRANDGQVSVVIAAEDGAQAHVTKFTGPHHPPAAWVDGEMLLVALHTRVVAISLATGEIAGETPVPKEMRWLSGRYFWSDSLAFACWNGGEVQWDSAMAARGWQRADILTVFDRDGIGPWVVTVTGEILGPTGAKSLAIDLRLEAAQIPPPGNRVYVKSAGGVGWHEIDLEHFKLTPGVKHALPQGVPPTGTWVGRFAAIAGAPGQPLRLRNVKGRWLEIYAPPGGMLRLAESKPEGISDHLFSPLSSPARLGCTLQRTQWPGGSTAWLDSRGFLHLRSHDASIPEISIALNFQAPLAIWSSDGTLAGLPFFLGENVPGDYARASGVLNRFCSALC